MARSWGDRVVKSLRGHGFYPISNPIQLRSLKRLITGSNSADEMDGQSRYMESTISHVQSHGQAAVMEKNVILRKPAVTGTQPPPL